MKAEDLTQLLESGVMTTDEICPVLYTISLIAPTSKNRIAMIAREAEGFLYLVSSLGAIVGSAIIKLLEKHGKDTPEHIGAYV